MIAMFNTYLIHNVIHNTFLIMYHLARWQGSRYNIFKTVCVCPSILIGIHSQNFT